MAAGKFDQDRKLEAEDLAESGYKGRYAASGLGNPDGAKLLQALGG